MTNKKLLTERLEQIRLTELGSRRDERLGQTRLTELGARSYERATTNNHAAYKAMLEETFEEIRKLSELKGGEYSGDDDRLLNFRRTAEALGLPMETVWAAYAAKHWDALMQWISDDRQGVERKRLESIDGRVDDLLVYLLLFKFRLKERGAS